MSSDKSDHLDISEADMSARLARFADLKPLPVQMDTSIPQEALDMIYARRLLPVIGPPAGGDTPISSAAPIRGAAGMTMTHAVCPPGQGPGLHAHKQTYETFTVLEGEFEMRWGEEGQHAVRLGKFDTLSVPPGVSRAFRNVSDVEGVLQVVISGGVHDMNDIRMPARAAATLGELAPEFKERLASSGISFDEATS